MNTKARSTLTRACLAAALVCNTAAAAITGTAAQEPPQVLFGDLFAEVQRARIFGDGKEFADAVPKTTPSRILSDYRAQRPATPDSLRRFVAAHFDLPPEITPAAAPPDAVSITDHIDRLWRTLTRTTPSAPPDSSLLTLPYPYVVPGGRFRELYYWDSYFTMLGLAQSGRQDLVDSMADDFAHLIDAYGHVPNGTRTYYLSRSQPPFFFAMAALTTAADPPAAYLRYLPQLEREHAFWMRGARGLRKGAAARRVVRLADGAVLNRYWDDRDSPRDESYREDTDLARTSGRQPSRLYRDIRAAAESGWDFSSRWFADAATRATLDTTQIVPVDLNSLMFGLETAIAVGCGRGHDLACARDFKAQAARRRAAIERYLWDPALGAYVDYRWTRRTRIARVSAATLYPLFVGLAPRSQAAAVARTVRTRLLKSGGVVTTLIDTGEQWDSPNGWAPLQWIAVDGLRRYHEDALAATIACRWMSGVNRVYRARGRLLEKYDVVDTGRAGGGGEYPTQDGFGWTNGVTARLAALYPAEAHYAAVEDCPATRASSMAVNVK